MKLSERPNTQRQLKQLYDNNIKNVELIDEVNVEMYGRTLMSGNHRMHSSKSMIDNIGSWAYFCEKFLIMPSTRDDSLFSVCAGEIDGTPCRIYLRFIMINPWIESNMWRFGYVIDDTYWTEERKELAEYRYKALMSK